MYVCSSVHVFCYVIFYFVCMFSTSVYSNVHCLHLTCPFFRLLACGVLHVFIYNIYFVHLIKKYSFSNKYSIIVKKLRFGVHTFLPHKNSTADESGKY